MMRRPLVSRIATRLAIGAGPGARPAAASLPAWAATHSVDLDGSTMRIQMDGAESVYDYAAGFTLAGWFKLDTTAATQGYWCFGDANAVNGEEAYLSSGAIREQTVSAGAGTRYSVGGAGAVAWQHVAWVCEPDAPTANRIYINGVDTTSSHPTTTPADLSAVLDTAALGARFWNGAPALHTDGHVLECVTIARKITAGEVVELYNGGVPFDVRTASLGADVADYISASANQGTATLTFQNLVTGNFTEATLINGDSSDLNGCAMSGRTYYEIPSALLYWRCLAQSGVLVTVTATGGEPADDALDGFTHTARMRLDGAFALVALRTGWPLPREWAGLSPVVTAAVLDHQWEVSIDAQEAWSAAPTAVLVPLDELTDALAAAALMQHAVWARYGHRLVEEDGVTKAVLWYDGDKPDALAAYPRRWRSQVEALPTATV